VSPRLLGVALAAILVAGGCSGTLQTASGVVLQVNGSSLTEIDSFVLRTADGELITFDVGPVTFDATSFPPEHLREHQALASPVRVTYQVQDGRKVAVKLEDAPGP
jgi:hypothetical protein